MSVNTCVYNKKFLSITSGVIPKNPRKIEFVNNPRNPMNNPVATNTGIIGTNTSPNVLLILWNKFPCFFASSFICAVEVSATPKRAIAS